MLGLSPRSHTGKVGPKLGDCVLVVGMNPAYCHLSSHWSPHSEWPGCSCVPSSSCRTEGWPPEAAAPRDMSNCFCTDACSKSRLDGSNSFKAGASAVGGVSGVGVPVIGRIMWRVGRPCGFQLRDAAPVYSLAASEVVLVRPTYQNPCQHWMRNSQ